MVHFGGRWCKHCAERGCVPECCLVLQKGYTPRRLAKKKGHAAVVETLSAAKEDKEATTQVRGLGGWGRQRCVQGSVDWLIADF